MTYKELFIDKTKTLIINTELAIILGDLNESIVLNQLNYWIEINKKVKKNFKDGRYWVYNTYGDWKTQNFPYWSEKTIQRTFTRLENKGVVISANYNKMKIDKTKWYSIDYDKLEEIVNDYHSRQDKMTDRQDKMTCREGHNDRAIPEITPENTNRDYSMYTSEKDKSFSEGENNINTSVIEEEGVKSTNKKKSRYIPDDYTEKQIVEHVYPIVVEEISNQLEDNVQETVANFLDVFRYFHRKYYEVTGKKHKVLADVSYRNIVRDFLFPPHVMSDKDEMYNPRAYSEMIDLYFEIDLNQRGNYDGEITKSLSHFMSDGIREYTFMRTRL